MASVSLPATNGETADLATLPGRVIVYAYPRTGKPGVENPDGWDMIPGARGCTPQSCSFRDHFAELKALGVDHLFGLSTQDPDYQREATERLHLPFAILSDQHLKLTRAMNLPTFEAGGATLLKRFTLVINDGTVEHVFYPVFPPDRNGAEENASQQRTRRTQSRERVSQTPERVRTAARFCRHYPRWEPDAGKLHVRFWAGGAG
jgi:peroxiredoxin